MVGAKIELDPHILPRLTPDIRHPYKDLQLSDVSLCCLKKKKDVFQISLSTIGSPFQSAFYSHLWKRGKIPNILVSFEKVDL